VLFDLDGVLADSTAVVDRIWRAWAEERGLDGQAVVAIAHGRPTLEVIRKVAPHLAAEPEARELEEREVAAASGVMPVPGARELLDALPEPSWAVVTSGTRWLAASRIEAIGARAPRVLVTADDVERGKPDPEGYLKAAAALGAEARRCVVVEDSPAGITAARVATMAVVGVTTTYAAAELAEAHVLVDSLEAVQVARVELSDGLPLLELVVGG
jgi:mannitol-1-/sugar-/sorbitol-6-phosphatase